VVAAWLRSVDLGAYAAVFVDKGITGRYLLTRMNEEKAAKLIPDEFHRDLFIDALADLRQRRPAAPTAATAAAATLSPQVQVQVLTAATAPRHLMPARSVPTGARARLTLDNKSTRDVRVYLLDAAGQPQLKRILRPYEAATEDAIEGQVFHLVDDREGWHLGWVRQLAVPILVSVPDQRTPAEQGRQPHPAAGRDDHDDDDDNDSRPPPAYEASLSGFYHRPSAGAGAADKR
jgi:hypothetical protein